MATVVMWFIFVWRLMDMLCLRGPTTTWNKRVARYGVRKTERIMHCFAFIVSEPKTCTVITNAILVLIEASACLGYTNYYTVTSMTPVPFTPHHWMT